MIIKKIKLENFRKFSNLELNFNNKYNLIYGNNAVGKTSIIEAIYFAEFLTSFRTNSTFDLIKFQEKIATVELDYLDNIGNLKKINIIFDKNQKKAFLNNKEIINYKDLFKQINLILISPSNIDLIDSSPRIRRKYLDQSISKFNSQYFDDLVLFKKLLKIKNNYLKSLKTNINKFDQLYYEIITKKIEILNEKLQLERINYLKQLEINTNNFIENILQKQVSYKYKVENKNLDQKNLQQLELKYLATMTGIHLDDYEIILDEKNLKKFGSQGQKRLISIAFFLGQNSFYLEKDTEKPLIIFDDVHLDLDEEKQKKVFEHIKDQNQIIYITTNIDKIKFLQDEQPKLIEIR